MAWPAESRAVHWRDWTASRAGTHSKHYTLHIGQLEEYHRYVPKIGIRAEKLIHQGWPGPLTLVFQLDPDQMEAQKSRLDDEMVRTLYKDNSIGIRCPDHPVASLLLRLTHRPVVAPSANYAGQPPATDANQVLAQLAGEVDMILDGGPCKHKQSSTVALVGKYGSSDPRRGVLATGLAADVQSDVSVRLHGQYVPQPYGRGSLPQILGRKNRVPH